MVRIGEVNHHVQMLTSRKAPCTVKAHLWAEGLSYLPISFVTILLIPFAFSILKTFGQNEILHATECKSDLN